MGSMSSGHSMGTLPPGLEGRRHSTTCLSDGLQPESATVDIHFSFVHKSMAHSNSHREAKSQMGLEYGCPFLHLPELGNCDPVQFATHLTHRILPKMTQCMESYLAGEAHSGTVNIAAVIQSKWF